MGFNLGNVAKGVGRQVNPFDNGATYNQPARTPAPQQQQRPIASTSAMQPINRNTITQGLIRKAPAPFAVGAGIGRSLIGTGQAVSGLYDLATPGLGTNRFSKGLNTAAVKTDSFVKQNNLPQSVYKAAQAGTDIGQLFAGTGEAKAAATAATKAVPTIGKVASKLPSITRGVDKLTAPIIKDGNLAARTGARIAKNVLNPKLQAGNAGFTALQVGKEASQGKDISPVNVGANLAIGGLVLPAAGAVGRELSAPVINKAASELRNAKLIPPSKLNSTEAAQLGNFINARGTNAMTDDVYSKGVQAAQKAGVHPNDVTAIDNLLGAHRSYETAVLNRKQQVQALAAQAKALKPQPLNEGGYAKNPLAGNEKVYNDPSTAINAERAAFLQSKGYTHISDGQSKVAMNDIISGKSTQQDYGMSHRPSADGPQAHDMAGHEWFGKDYYTRPESYGANLSQAADRESLASLQKIKGNPNGDVTIYRASPKNEFNHGDWVSLSKKYAQQEAKAEGVPVNALTVKAKDVRNAGDSINEFGYFPDKSKPSGSHHPTLLSTAADTAKGMLTSLNKDQGGYAKNPFGNKAAVNETGNVTSDEYKTISTAKQPKQLPSKQAQVPSQKISGSLADNSTVSRGTVSDTAASSTVQLPGEAAPATVQMPKVDGGSLPQDNIKLPEYGTKKVSGADKMFRSTRSIIERSGEHGKSLAGDLQGARDTQEIMIAKIQKQLPTVRSLKGKDFENFVEATQGNTTPANPKIAKAVQEWQATHPQIRERAVNPNGAALDVGDLGPTYYPHFIDYDKVFKDKNMYNASINHLVETGQATDAADAIAKLNHAKDVSRNRSFGNLEASREIDLPFYDKTPNSLVSYIGSSSKRIAQAETFGAKDEKALAKIAEAGKQGYDTEAMKNAYNVASGAKIYDSTAQNVSNKLRSYQSTTRLGLGALTNVSQNVNTGIVTGHLRTLTAMTKQLSPKTRNFVADTGVIADSVLNDLKTQSGFVGKTLGHITAPGFGKVESFNRAVSATAGRDYALRLAQKGDEKTLRRLGVTGEIQGKTLTEAQQIQAARKVVEKTQFKVDPQDLPGWVDSPGGKLVSQFRTFSYAQGKFVSNEVLKPLAKGNVLPAARLLAALPLGYELYETKRKINGRPEETSATKRGLATFQNVGGAGLAFDIYQGLNPPNSKYTPTDRRVSMALGTLGGPTLGLAGQVAGAVSDLVQRKNVPSDTAKLGGKVTIGNNGKTYTDATQAARLGLSQIPIVGGPIKNRVLPYKKQSDAENGFADSKKSTPSPFEALGQVLGKLTGQKDTSAATASASDAIAKVKAEDKANQAKYKATLSKSDYELSTLNKQDRQKLVDQGVVTQDKLKGLDNYTKNQKQSLGLSSPTNKGIDVNKTIDAHSQKVLNEYNNLDSATIKSKSIKEPTYDYKVAVAKYANDKANNSLSTAQDLRAKDNIDKLNVGQNYAKEVRDIYGLPKSDILEAINNDKTGKLADQLTSYDKDLNAKLGDKLKFKYGFGSSNGKRGKGNYTAGGRAKKGSLPKISYGRAPKTNYSLRLAGSKGGKSGKVKLATYKIPKAVTFKKPKGVLAWDTKPLLQMKWSLPVNQASACLPTVIALTSLQVNVRLTTVKDGMQIIQKQQYI